MQLVICSILLTCITIPAMSNAGDTGIWMKHEISFTSGRTYDNPVYDVRTFNAAFTSPSGREKHINGFWDGGREWKIRFMPDEPGAWTWKTACSDSENSGLHNVTGSFECAPNNSAFDFHRHGTVIRQKGNYHLTFADGTPFFWLGDTAWNGALFSTDDEWNDYLAHRSGQNYSVIQVVTTQWRGAKGDRYGETAFDGVGKIEINVDFFKRLDKKIDHINDFGMIAAPVLLWALPSVTGRELNPGYILPHEEAILLARYMVARWGGNHVAWILGGDGVYTNEYEQRWKVIGREVFGGEHPGLATTHTCGRSWIGDIYAREEWLDIVPYQSSHSTGQKTVEFITTGPAASQWSMLPARPVMNLEPIYEEIMRPDGSIYGTEREVRNAVWWSIFAAPVSGVSYGTPAIWGWVRDPGEEILNHRGHQAVRDWRAALNLPAGNQMEYLADFLRDFDWWDIRPCPELLAEQPGTQSYENHISVAAGPEKEIIMVYIPGKIDIILYSPSGKSYSGLWFNPSDNTMMNASLRHEEGKIISTPPADTDMVLVLRAE